MRQKGGAGEIAILQDNRSGRLSYWQGHDHQSVTDRYGVSLAPYIHALFGLLRQKKARRVLIIGCGGGSLATMLCRAGAKVTLLDVDPRAFAIARRYFHLPASVDCHISDGAKFLRRNPSPSLDRYDAIVLDAFAGGRIPGQFLTGQFFRLAKARLRRGGVLLANLVIDGDDDPLLVTMANSLSPVWRYRRVLDVKSAGIRNVIVAAGAVKDLRVPRLMMAPAIPYPPLGRNTARIFLSSVALKTRFSARNHAPELCLTFAFSFCSGGGAEHISRSKEQEGVQVPPIPILDSLVLTALFGFSGLLHIAGPNFLRQAYRRWGFPHNSHRVIGVLQVLTALFLSNPVTRIWGVALASFILFYATVALIHHRKYVYSLPGLILMLALVPATLAGPL